MVHICYLVVSFRACSTVAVSTWPVSSNSRLLRDTTSCVLLHSAAALYYIVSRPSTWSTNQQSAFRITPSRHRHLPTALTMLCRQTSVTSHLSLEVDCAGYHLCGSWPVLLNFDWSTNFQHRLMLWHCRVVSGFRHIVNSSVLPLQYTTTMEWPTLLDSHWLTLWQTFILDRLQSRPTVEFFMYCFVEWIDNYISFCWYWKLLCI